MIQKTPDYLLFAQHGWANNNYEISQIAQSLASENTVIIAPSLGWLNTWISMKLLINKLEKIALNYITQYPYIPIRIIAHSMGGLIWLELLNKHPEWWGKIESLILITSPIGGADLARIIDPLGLGIGTAKDLGKNRRKLAEKIAQSIPTLIIASDLDRGSDGMITIESMKFRYAHYTCLTGIHHAIMKNHPQVARKIKEFWQNPHIPHHDYTDLSHQLIAELQSVTGMTDGHYRDFERSQVYIEFPQGITLNTWTNPLLVDHVFVGNQQKECLYSGFVGLIHKRKLQQKLRDIKSKY
jgi:hypothetical protein